MLIQNNYSNINESTTILENATYLSEYESIISPYSIPVVENTRLGTNIVSYEDIERLCEEYGWSINTGIQKICESNHIDGESITISVPEYKILENSSIIEELGNYKYAISPLSEDNIVSQYVDACLESYLESGGDESYLELMVNPSML